MMVLATSAAAAGFVGTSEHYWESKLLSRAAHPVFDRTGQLIGALPSQEMDRDDAARFAHVPVQGDLPPVYVKTLKWVEDRGFGETRACDIDWMATIGRAVKSLGSQGGSGIAQQTAKQLLADESPLPDWIPSKAGKVLNKFVELGAACSLAGYFASRGGSDAMLKTYAATAPVAQGAGTLRGIEAGARLIFDVSPSELSPAQQAVLAVSVKRPLLALSKEDLTVPCERVWPRTGQSYDQEVARAHPAREHWCRALHRAGTALPAVLEGDELAQALAELETLADKGFEVQSGLRLPQTSLINLTARLHAMVPAEVRKDLQRDVEKRESLEPGTPLTLTLDAERSVRMSHAVRAVLNSQQSLLQRHFCMPLPYTGAAGRATVSGNCPATSEPASEAAILFNATARPNGGVTSIQSSYAGFMDIAVQMGSTAKIVLAYVAARAGFGASMKVCPKQVKANGVLLQRTTSPRSGFTDAECRNPHNLVTLERAVGLSDNLASYELAVMLGQTRLARGIAELGLPVNPGEDLEYQLAIGPVQATPRQILTAWTAVVTEGYGHGAPGGTSVHLLAQAGSDLEVEAGAQRVKVSLTPAARTDLRKMLEAPIAPGGTLHFLGGRSLSAGKSGTTQSPSRTADGIKAVAAKLAVTYDPGTRESSVLILTSPNSRPLAPPGLPTRQLQALYLAALTTK